MMHEVDDAPGEGGVGSTSGRLVPGNRRSTTPPFCHRAVALSRRLTTAHTPPSDRGTGRPQRVKRSAQGGPARRPNAGPPVNPGPVATFAYPRHTAPWVVPVCAFDGAHAE